MIATAKPRKAPSWERALCTQASDLPIPVAQWMMTQLSLSDEDSTRARELYEKAKDGTLSKEEDAELEEIGDASLIIDRLRIRAAGSLKRAGLALT